MKEAAARKKTKKADEDGVTKRQTVAKKKAEEAAARKKAEGVRVSVRVSIREDNPLTINTYQHNSIYHIIEGFGFGAPTMYSMPATVLIYG